MCAGLRVSLGAVGKFGHIQAKMDKCDRSGWIKDWAEMDEISIGLVSVYLQI